MRRVGGLEGLGGGRGWQVGGVRWEGWEGWQGNCEKKGCDGERRVRRRV